MVQPDIAGYPLQDLRQLVVGGPLQGRRHGLPLLGARPARRVELVLDVEQPDAACSAQQHDGHLDQQVGLDPDSTCSGDEDTRDHSIRQDNAHDLVAARSPGGQPVSEHEREKGPDPEHDDRVSEDPVPQPP